MSVSEARDAVRNLVIAAVDRVESRSERTVDFRGIAFHDPAKDEVFTSLEQFDAAEAAIREFPLVQERSWESEAGRIALQFIYEFLAGVSEATFEPNLFDELWEDFVAELAEPDWIYRSVANVEYVSAQGDLYHLDDGVSIRRRSIEELAELGFAEGIVEALADDWSGHGASSYVMVVEERLPKTADNFILASGGAEFIRAQRVLGALRLLARGDIRIGPMWISHAARFNFGWGGTLIAGYSIPTFGSRYELTNSIAAAVPEMCGKLRHLETHGYGGAPGNLDLALRSFMATYDRPALHGDSGLLDSITALEAVLGSGAEITFKLSFRVAAILGQEDADRVEIFERMKAYYDLRSTLVHGAKLKEKHQALMADVGPLRDLVRELLKGFVHLAIAPDERFNKEFFQKRLDSALQSESERQALRRALGLN